MDIYLVNYADDRYSHKGGKFREWQKHLNETAQEQGINRIISWQWEDLIKTEFYQEHKDYLDKSRFDNGAVWKPFIILEVLKQIQYDDVILYSDCVPWGIKRAVQPLVDLCLKNNGTFFQQLRDKNYMWTKRDAFVYMECDEPIYHLAPALQNTWICLQKNDYNINFISEWLQYNLDERIASYRRPNSCGLPNFPGFIENRGDQSIFTNLAIKYGIKTYHITRSKNINYFIDLVNMPKPFRLPYKLFVKFRWRLEKWTTGKLRSYFT
jgi:hypothetical protein